MPQQKKILMIFTGHDQFDNSERKTGYWLSEAAHFYYPIRDAGYIIDFTSPHGAIPPVDPASAKRPDALSRRWLNDPEVQTTLAQPKSSNEINPSEYVAVYYPGGHGPLWDLATDKDIAKKTAEVYEQGGVVAAVCHGSAALLPIHLSTGEHLLMDKSYTGFTNAEERLAAKTTMVPFLLEDKMKALGGVFVKKLPFLVHAVVSGRLVTGQNPRSAGAVTQEVLKILKDI